MTDPAPVTSGIGGFTKEDAIRMSKKVGEAGLGYAKVALEKGKSSFNEAKEAGMFKLESLTAFNKDVVNVFATIKGDVERVTGGQVTAQEAIMKALAFKPNDPQPGFIFMNSVALWMEVFGSTLSWVFTGFVGLPFFLSTVLFSYIVAYTLYFSVVLSNKPNLMGLAVIGYAIYALLNAMSVVGSLILIIPPVFYGLKTLACGYCSFYAYQLKDKLAGAEQIP